MKPPPPIIIINPELSSRPAVTDVPQISSTKFLSKRFDAPSNKNLSKDSSKIPKPIKVYLFPKHAPNLKPIIISSSSTSLKVPSMATMFDDDKLEAHSTGSRLKKENVSVSKNVQRPSNNVSDVLLYDVSPQQALSSRNILTLDHYPSNLLSIKHDKDDCCRTDHTENHSTKAFNTGEHADVVHTVHHRYFFEPHQDYFLEVL